jgi:hypothetical protein
MSAGHFECKVERRSENAKGIFITLLINPADHDEALSQVRVGSALVMGWSEIVDTSVQPIEIARPDATPAGAVVAVTSGATGRRDGQPKRKFSDLSLPEQAGIRCNDVAFREFISLRDSGGVNAEPCVIPYAENFVRRECGVDSRAELAKFSDARNKWLGLEADYQSWLVSRQYADSVR